MVTDNQLLEMCRRMMRIRQFENTTAELLKKGELYGAFHTSVGQEASIVGSCMALANQDYMVGTHRSHGHPIGKGAKLGPLMAELMGREGGVNKGKGGSMHMSDFSVGSLGETSIVGSGFPIATGAALGSKMQGNGKVSLCFFGDGAANQGTFHESLNLAAVWKLPVIYVCENNGIGELTATTTVMPIENIADRAAGYAMPGVTVDGQDVIAVYEAVHKAVLRARAGDGPSLIETKTYRFDPHSIGLSIENRDAKEIQEWRSLRDPLELFRKTLSARGVTAATMDGIASEVASEIAAAVEFGRASPIPPLEAAFTHVFTNPIEIYR